MNHLLLMWSPTSVLWSARLLVTMVGDPEPPIHLIHIYLPRQGISIIRKGLGPREGRSKSHSWELFRTDAQPWPSALPPQQGLVLPAFPPGSCGREMGVKEGCLSRKLRMWTCKRQADMGICPSKSLSSSKPWLLLLNPEGHEQSPCLSPTSSVRQQPLPPCHTPAAEP